MDTNITNSQTIREKVGSKVAQYREAHNYSWDDLAKKSGLSRKTIYNVESGRKVTLETLIKLASVMGISIIELAEIKDIGRPVV